jgi:hypothetical protein
VGTSVSPLRGYRVVGCEYQCGVLEFAGVGDAQFAVVDTPRETWRRQVAASVFLV